MLRVKDDKPAAERSGQRDPQTNPRAGVAPARPPVERAKAGAGPDDAGESKNARPETPKPSLKERLNRAWRIAVIAGWVALGGALGYAVGAIEGRFALQRQTRSFVQQSTESQARHAAAAERERALLARRDLHRALIALEQRNFGTTEQHARRAGNLLGELSEDYAGLTEELRAFRPTVSDDIGQQQEVLLATAARLDKLIGELPELDMAKAPAAASSETSQ